MGPYTALNDARAAQQRPPGPFSFRSPQLAVGKVEIEVATGPVLDACRDTLDLLIEVMELVPEWSQFELRPLQAKGIRLSRAIKRELARQRDGLEDDDGNRQG